MATLTQLMRSNKQKPIRRCYIKRRDTDGDFEAEWQRVDVKAGDRTNRVLRWGQISHEIDHSPGEIGLFDVSELQIVFVNDDGFFNVETDAQSFWAPESSYINRKFSKLKIECGYIDTDGETEVGVESIFEGFIDSVKVSEDQRALVTVLSYQSILNRYSVSDLSMTGTKSINTVVDLIMNQSKITKFIPFVASAANENVNVSNTEDLEGTYWDVLRDLSFKSNSTILLSGTSFSFKPREVGASSVFDFRGAGSEEASLDIFKVLDYEDEGADRVRVFWKAQGRNLTATSTDSSLLTKYLGEPEIIDLEDLEDDPTRQQVLDSYLADWENNKPRIEFLTRFLVNTLTPLDKITIEILGSILPAGSVFRWDAWSWDDGSLWGELRGGINILSGSEWMVTRVVKDLDTWSMIVKAEKQT